MLSSAIGVGALLSALWIAWGNRQPHIRGLLIGTVAFSVLLALFSVSHIYPLSLVLILLVGFSQVAFSAMANTALQSITPGHLRGRVMSVYMAFFAGSTPIGNLLIGGLSILVGPSLSLLICALLALASALAGWFWRKPAEKDLAQGRAGTCSFAHNPLSFLEKEEEDQVDPRPFFYALLRAPLVRKRSVCCLPLPLAPVSRSRPHTGRSQHRQQIAINTVL